MKDFLLKNWKTLLLILISVVLAVIITRHCSRSPDTPNQVSMDSLQTANTTTQAIAERKSDSLEGIISEKDKTAVQLVKALNSVTAKYELIRHRNPVHDTIVKDSIVFNGNEALEKIPIMEAQLLNCESKVDNYKQLVITKTNQNIALQDQFNRSMAISQAQEKEAKKLKRKIKWAKIGLVTESIVLLGTAVVVIVSP